MTMYGSFKKRGIIDMKKTSIVLICLCAIFASIAFAAVKCSFSIESPASIGANELKSGTYSVRVDGATAVITPKLGKPFEVPAKIETLEKKYGGETAVNSATRNGKKMIDSVTVGHSKTKIVFAQ